MVNHDIPHGISSERVVTVMYFRLAAAETHVTHNDIVRIHPEGLPCYADSVSRSGLSGNGHIRSADNDGRFQLDDKVAAELLGIGRTTLYNKLEEYGLKYKFEQP